MSAEATEVAPAVEAVPIPAGVSIANHPRARVSIRRARARVALFAFGLVILQAHGAGVPGQEAVLRGVMAGLGAFLAVWAIGLAVWKQILLAELRTAHRRRQERRAAAERRRAEAVEAAEAAKAAASGARP
jgi:hypothetical protein